MAELSNSLRQRLGAVQNGQQTHPDADLLTAFVEQALSTAERAEVLGHLSVCWECRQVVALSLPQPPESAIQPVITPAPVSGWRRWFTPAFGLAGLVTAMAVVALVVMQVPGKRGTEKQSQQAQVAPVKDQAPETDQKKDAGTAESFSAESRERMPAANEAEKLRAGNVSRPAPRAAIPARTSAGRPIAAGDQPLLGVFPSRQDFVNTGLFEANVEYKANDKNLPAAPQPQPSKSETRFVVNAPEIMTFSDIPAGQPAGNSNVRILNPPTPPERHPWVISVIRNGAGHVKALATPPAISAGGIAFHTMGGQSKFSADLMKQHPAEVAAAPEKPGAEGLQRFDTLSHRSMAADESSAAEMGAAWKASGGKLLRSTKPGQWDEAYPGASFQFTFVSARGNEVWAGGTHASVVHSHDGGRSWEAPRLGDAASGSIVSILFSGATIQVRTSDDQSWSSSDGGKTWAQQTPEN